MIDNNAAITQCSGPALQSFYGVRWGHLEKEQNQSVGRKDLKIGVSWIKSICDISK